ncbi:hypothetical protein GCM10023350_22970 [Nocardioides endophyticus]|uniref:VOC domain-containing protein n=1 Tax=Nocardioides endophyticus TaxID=1353775 RepID=A0ABP8YUI5_9ACTN
MPDPQATAAFLSDGLQLQVVEDGGRFLAIVDGEYGAPRGQAAIEFRAGPEHLVESLVLALPHDADLAELAGLVGGQRVSDTEVSVVDPTTEIPIRLALAPGLAVSVPEPSVLRPRRMGHVNLASPRPAETARFFIDVIGLRLSEYIGEALFWMRTDTEHHNVALRPGRTRSAHHLGMEVAGWHAYQPILDHLDSQGYKIEFGPGRHRPGRSLFVYVCDPTSGLRVELFADMVHLPDPTAPAIGWEPGDRMTKTLNTWGPLPPESFLA